MKCEKCGAEMQTLCLTSIPPQYEYHCFSCGHTIKSSLVSEPYQATFDKIVWTKDELSELIKEEVQKLWDTYLWKEIDKWLDKQYERIYREDESINDN